MIALASVGGTSPAWSAQRQSAFPPAGNDIAPERDVAPGAFVVIARLVSCFAARFIPERADGGRSSSRGEDRQRRLLRSSCRSHGWRRDLGQLQREGRAASDGTLDA